MAVKLNMDGLTHIESYMQRVAKDHVVAAALKAEATELRHVAG